VRRLRVAFLRLLKSVVIGVDRGCAKAASLSFLRREFSRIALYRSYFLAVVVGVVVAAGTANTVAADEAPGVVGVSTLE